MFLIKELLNIGIQGLMEMLRCYGRYTTETAEHRATFKILPKSLSGYRYVIIMFSEKFTCKIIGQQLDNILDVFLTNCPSYEYH